MASRNQPWHKRPILADPRWFSFNGDSDGSPFASASPLYGIPAGLGNPEDEYDESPSPDVGDALDRLMERLSEDERTVLEMRVAGLPFSVIAFERGWLLPPRPDRGYSPDSVADKRKAHRIALRAARKLRAMIEDAEDMDGVIPRPRAAA